ncbi:hypothetical protein MHYP_G00115310, partial [Metynnis hypsauchen]
GHTVTLRFLVDSPRCSSALKTYTRCAFYLHKGEMLQLNKKHISTSQSQRRRRGLSEYGWEKRRKASVECWRMRRMSAVGLKTESCLASQFSDPTCSFSLPALNPAPSPAEQTEMENVNTTTKRALSKTDLTD